MMHDMLWDKSSHVKVCCFMFTSCLLMLMLMPIYVTVERGGIRLVTNMDGSHMQVC